jgi:hypothetical protein
VADPMIEAQPGYAKLALNGEKVFGLGDVVAFLPHEIHSVINDNDYITVSLHIYGKHLNYTGRSQFDVAQNTEKAFIIKQQ